jgi:hypothetical protein
LRGWCSANSKNFRDSTMKIYAFTAYSFDAIINVEICGVIFARQQHLGG